MAISTYVLVGFLRRDKRSNEAALKYLLLGAFSSGIFAYGLSLFYGLTGSTNLGQIAQKLQEVIATCHRRTLFGGGPLLLHAHCQLDADAPADRCRAGQDQPRDALGVDHHRSRHSGYRALPELLYQCCELVAGIGAGHAAHGEDVAMI
jgi:Proton-conducting membrane transporter